MGLQINDYYAISREKIQRLKFLFVELRSQLPQFLKNTS